MGQHMGFWYLMHMRKSPLSSHSDISSRVRELNFGLSFHLHPHFVYVNSKVNLDTKISYAGSYRIFCVFDIRSNLAVFPQFYLLLILQNTSQYVLSNCKSFCENRNIF